MKHHIAVLAMSVIAMAGCEAKKSVNVSAPGTEVRTGEGGAKVSAPGVNVDAGPGGAKVDAPGVKVDTK